MNLREEIAHLIEQVIVDPLQYQSITQSDRIINKVLDAVIEEVECGDGQIWINDPNKMYISVENVKKAINKVGNEK